MRVISEKHISKKTKKVITPEETKRCNRCGITKNILKDFPIKVDLRIGRGSDNPRPGSRCKQCCNEIRNERRGKKLQVSNPEKYEQQRLLSNERARQKYRQTQSKKEKFAELVESLKEIKPKHEAFNTKFCPGCEEIKDIDQFGKLTSAWDGLKPQCKDCSKKQRKHYDENILAKMKELRKEMKQFINNLKDKPCLDCGQKFAPFVMDYDHRPGEIKLFNISNNSYYKEEDKQIIIAEIAKCDLVCANCHRMRTQARLEI